MVLNTGVRSLFRLPLSVSRGTCGLVNMANRREEQVCTVKDIVKAGEAGSLVRNPEYQRGEACTLPQKQALIDSLYRRYPIPPLFLD